MNPSTSLGINQKLPSDKQREFLISRKVLLDYFTASFKAFAALNFGTFIAGTCTEAPVRGLRAVRAALCLVEKIPRPATETSPPDLRVLTIWLIMISTTSSAWTLVPPSLACTASARPALFMFLKD